MATVYKFVETFEVDSQDISDLIESARQGIGYWANRLKDRGEALQFAEVSWSADDFNSGIGKLGEYYLSYGAIARAVEDIARGKVEVAEDIIEVANQWLRGSSSGDSEFADVVIQVALFDDVIYG